MVKLPKDTKNWKEDVVTALQFKLNKAVMNDKIDQGNLAKALDDIRHSDDPIYLQKGGDHIGIVKGLPKGLRKEKMKRVLYFIEKIVREEEPIIPEIPDEGRLFKAGQHVTEFKVNGLKISYDKHCE